MENNRNDARDKDPRKEPGDELDADDLLTPDGKVNIEDDKDKSQQQDLLFNKEENSYELDIASEDPDYQHGDPYDTAAPGGSDDDSDWDEDNPLIGDEYDEGKSLESDLDDLSMHIDSGIKHLSKLDEKLSRTPEDERDDLDEEGYPKRYKD
ncbi:hypothetical protein SAMN05216436_10246 [bacterium A37T11]|nr:hypothetical protein SAMN05216436_10246 [bacterium A37T11]